jgi:hypothetical protein
MFVRAAFCLTFLFLAGVGVAAKSNRLQEPASHAVSRAYQASFIPGANSIAQETATSRYVPTPEVEGLIRQGNKRMREGDILGARQSYQKAVATGDVAAALVMGRSYDPIYFARIAERNAEPDPVKAFAWYHRAKDAGAVQTAMVRIDDLKVFLRK